MGNKRCTKLGAIMIVIVMISSLFVGCGEKKSSKEVKASENVIKFNLGKEPKTLDPALNSDDCGKTV